jgi:hypothetical protein
MFIKAQVAVEADTSLNPPTHPLTHSLTHSSAYEIVTTDLIFVKFVQRKFQSNSQNVQT